MQSIRTACNGLTAKNFSYPQPEHNKSLAHAGLLFYQYLSGHTSYFKIKKTHFKAYVMLSRVEA